MDPSVEYFCALHRTLLRSVLSWPCAPLLRVCTGPSALHAGTPVCIPMHSLSDGSGLVEASVCELTASFERSGYFLLFNGEGSAISKGVQRRT